MKDADEARQAVRSHGTLQGAQAALKYEDQINDASTILGWRRRNPSWQKPVNLSANLKPALRELAASSEQISPTEARKRMLRYNLQKSIDKSGDAMTTPGLLLGGITGAGIAARRGNVRGALAGAAIGAPLGMVGLRMTGRLEEKRRLAGMLQPTEKKLSAFHGKLREFAGGYMNTSQGVVKEESVGGHLRRHAGAYVGTALAPVLGTGIGALIDAARKRSNLIKTSDESVVSARTAAALGGRERLMSANLKPALRELALVRDANGQLVEDGNNGGSGFKTAAKVGLGAAGVAGGAVLGTRYYHANKAVQEAGGWRKNWSDLSKMSQAGDAQGMMDWSKNISATAQNSARQGWMGKLGKVGNVLTKFSANLKPALRELAARSGRILEFGDGEANEAVIAALKAVASADESPAQRSMLLKQGLIEMVKGQVVITERGYEMMQKAGVPPKLTPEERREEIAESSGAKREFARGDYLLKARKWASNEALMGRMPLTRGSSLNPFAPMPPAPIRKGGTQKRAAAWLRSVKKELSRIEFARGDYAIPALKKIYRNGGPLRGLKSGRVGVESSLRGDPVGILKDRADAKFASRIDPAGELHGAGHHMTVNRKWAAATIRDVRSLRPEWLRA